MCQPGGDSEDAAMSLRGAGQCYCPVRCVENFIFSILYSKRLKCVLIYYLFSLAQSVEIVSGKSP